MKTQDEISLRDDWNILQQALQSTTPSSYLVLNELHHGILVVEESVLLLHTPVDGTKELAISCLREVMGLCS